MSKPVTAVNAGTGEVVVVCDDGAVWVYVWREGTWDHLPPVPGTPAHDAQG